MQKLYFKEQDGTQKSIEIAEDVIDKDEIEVAPVVRCEKCKHAHRTGVKDVYFCDVFECEVTHDFYCKDGVENGTPV